MPLAQRPQLRALGRGRVVRRDEFRRALLRSEVLLVLAPRAVVAREGLLRVGRLDLAVLVDGAGA